MALTQTISLYRWIHQTNLVLLHIPLPYVLYTHQFDHFHLSQLGNPQYLNPFPESYPTLTALHPLNLILPYEVLQSDSHSLGNQCRIQTILKRLLPPHFSYK